jgi:SnoaL-like domain
MSELLAAIAESDRDGLEGMLAEDVVFHSPVQTYRGRPQAVRLLVTIGSVVDDVEVTRTLDGVTFFTATVEEHPVDGVLVQEAGDDGQIAQITLMLRPLAQLQAAVARMARALAGPG